MEKALISVLMEEFMDDSLEVDNFILQTTSQVTVGNLSVLACFDDGSRRTPRNQSPDNYDDDDDYFEPPRKKRKRGRGRPRGSVSRPRRGRGRPRGRPRRSIETMAECVLPNYSEMDFKTHFGMSRVTFEELCSHIAPAVAYRTIRVEKKLLLTVWILCSRESYGVVSERFDVSKGFLHGICNSVCSALSAIEKEFIKMPKTYDLDGITKGFYQKCKFPGVVGAIGSTHIPIREPPKNTESYINKEGSFSIQLQVVCDDQLKFIHVHTGCPGSLHNAQIFEESPLYDILENNYLPVDKHIIGDSSYPLKPYLLVPFEEDKPLTDVEKQFNQNLSFTCTEVELAIKLLKQKFQRLKFLDIKQVDDISVAVTAACVMYNFILLKENVEDDICELAITEVRDEFEVDITPEPCPLSEYTSEEAIMKRMDIAICHSNVASYE